VAGNNLTKALIGGNENLNLKPPFLALRVGNKVGITYFEID